MTMTAGEMLKEAIDHEMSFLAHTYLYAIQNKIIDVNSSNLLNLTDDDFLKIKEMEAQNVLNIKPVKLIGVPIASKTGVWAMYFVNDEHQVNALHQRAYGHKPSRIADMTDKKDYPLYFPERQNQRVINFWNLQKETIELPRLVLEFTS